MVTGKPHTCPVPGCAVGCSPGHTVCRTHWLRVSKRHRAVLVEAFRRRETDPPTYAAAVDLATELATKGAR